MAVVLAINKSTKTIRLFVPADFFKNIKGDTWSDDVFGIFVVWVATVVPFILNTALFASPLTSKLKLTHVAAGNTVEVVVLVVVDAATVLHNQFTLVALVYSKKKPAVCVTDPEAFEVFPNPTISVPSSVASNSVGI
jgi:hypothetical protein